jgi:hypothetical protein
MLFLSWHLSPLKKLEHSFHLPYAVLHNCLLHRGTPFHAPFTRLRWNLPWKINWLKSLLFWFSSAAADQGVTTLAVCVRDSTAFSLNQTLLLLVKHHQPTLCIQKQNYCSNNLTHTLPIAYYPKRLIKRFHHLEISHWFSCYHNHYPLSIYSRFSPIMSIIIIDWNTR